MSNLTCTKCGNALKSNAKFCSDCGTPVIPPINKPQPPKPRKPVRRRTPPAPPVRKPAAAQPAQPVQQHAAPPQPVYRQPKRRKKGGAWGKILALTGGGILIAVCCVVIFAGATFLVVTQVDFDGGGTSTGDGGDIISSEPIPPDALATQQADSLPGAQDMVLTLTAVAPGQ